MKFKVGDKVTIREDLSRHEWNVVDSMEQYRGKVATIVAVGDYYIIDLDNGNWYWDDNMFEEDNAKTGEEKFRAFLNEIARGDKTADSDEYYEMYSNLSDVVTALNDECSTHEEVDAFIDAIVEFYSNFEPKATPKPKKMTLEDIEKELGYKVEIVEE